MTSLALTFHDTQFDIIDHNNQPWLKSGQIAEALGYTDKSSINRIFSRNRDEFTDSMTASVKLTDPNGDLQETRIFSLRGCHLIAMFSRTKVAKEFRKWVLDILDKETTGQLPEPQTITKAQQGILYNRVKTIAKESGKIRAELWSRFQNHFQLASYKDLPADRFDEACAYLDEKEKEYSNGVKMLYISEAELEKRVSEKVRAIEGELLSKPDLSDTDIEQWVEKLRGEGYLVAKPNPHDLRKMLRSYMPLPVFKEFVKIIKAHMEATGFTDIEIHGDSLQFRFSSLDNRARVVLSRDTHGVNIQVIDPHAWIVTPEQIKQHIDRILPGYTLISS